MNQVGNVKTIGCVTFNTLTVLTLMTLPGLGCHPLRVGLDTLDLFRKIRPIDRSLYFFDEPGRT